MGSISLKNMDIIQNITYNEQYSSPQGLSATGWNFNQDTDMSSTISSSSLPFSSFIKMVPSRVAPQTKSPHMHYIYLYEPNLT